MLIEFLKNRIRALGGVIPVSKTDAKPGSNSKSNSIDEKKKPFKTSKENSFKVTKADICQFPK